MKVNTNRLVNGFIAVLVVVLYFSTLIHYSPQHKSITDVVDFYTVDNNLPPIDPPLPDTLPHRDYLKRKEAIIRTHAINDGVLYNRASMTVGVIGIGGGLDCDTCTINNENPEKSAVQRYYIKLPGWRLKKAYTGDDSLRFYVKHGQGYLRKNKMDAAKKRLYQVDVPVNFRYNASRPEILVPVSDGTAAIVKVICGAMAISISIYVLYVAAAFLKLLIDISKGESFTAKNVSRLKLIAFSLLGYPVVIILLNLAMRVIFHNYFSSDVELAVNLWTDSRRFILAGGIFFTLFRAFSQGMKLKEEHDLTV